MRANVILLATLLLLGATASASDDSFAAGKEAFDRGEKVPPRPDSE